MGYLSCNAESAIAICDPYIWDNKRKPFQITNFSYADLESATNGFSAESFLGKGSYGSVYRALLHHGKLIAAVKRAISPQQHNNKCASCTNCSTCSNSTSPADNEIEILSRVRNPRLVNLLGFSVDRNEKKLIVVEFMPNGSLYDILHSSPRPPSWRRRVRWASQIAKAVESLHSSNPPVIHRDIKSSNVLLDGKWNARLGDFGLALRGHVEDVRVRCTPPAGTLGYLDPGYLAPGDLSTKSDVFSFGILLLEMISGRNAIDVNYSPPSVVDWAVPLIKHTNFSAICDPRIGEPEDPRVIRQLAVLAARCVRSTAEKRPAATEVVDCLRNVRKMVQSPPIWGNVRRRVQRPSRSRQMTLEVLDGSGEMVKTKKLGSRRNRKVSSVPGAEEGNEAVGSLSDGVIRSKSIGSGSEIKMGWDPKKKPGLVVKMPVMRLVKSRSMGVVQSKRLLHCHQFAFELDKRAHAFRELSEPKLLVSWDKRPLIQKCILKQDTAVIESKEPNPVGLKTL